MKGKLPKKLQGVLWSRKISNLDLKKDQNYIINQILAYGGWNHLTWLVKNYNKDQIKKSFIDKPEKDYSERTFNFVKNILLEIPNSLDKHRYVKNYPRIIR